MRKPFTIIPKDKKLLKSKEVKKWLREVEKLVKKEMESNKTAWWVK